MQVDRNALVGEIRRFNRFYTRTIGLLDETLTESDFTLAEARVLFELGHREDPVASEIAEALRLDPAYLARIIRRFAVGGLTEVRADGTDRRRRILSLTDKGKAALAELQVAADRDIAHLLRDLSDEKLCELQGALTKMMELLHGSPSEGPAVTLRPYRIGDVGWVIQRQAVLYAEEYGWDITYEALAAEIGAAFIRNFREGRDFCWIAELDGRRAGAIFLLHQDDETARLRLLHVEAAARGLGIGRRLVDTCIEQARASGYRRVVLWTNDVLVAARAIYERAGFRLVSEERHRSFGKDLVGQTWGLALQAGAR
ncbi:bifunctional helix-turn-helix transcriptional regulator/GNAT family N-acetyltransferase [Sinorhizobium arboris]|uniref:bifunctional helix-turn-helix transcriptional regulator/GNAT family N-acetyltransferase n=1 Tax=Sinorhizobium arboris TaxID=76745 RepID=UPI00042497F5|nr:helix-turn-helix domain-containing GNAT family N-acetyltransferase [Sinorhizobium arboris]